MAFWDKIRKDAEKSFKEGIATIRLKAEELTEEGKKKYRLYELKSRIHEEMADLGGLVYGVFDKDKNPMDDAKVIASLQKIKKMEEQIKKLGVGEKKKPAAKKKAAPKKKAATKKKTTAKKKAAPKKAEPPKP